MPRRKPATGAAAAAASSAVATPQASQTAMTVAPRGSGPDFDAQLEVLRTKYSLLGKEEWWWVFDDTLAVIGKALKRNNFCVLDNFVLNSQVGPLRAEIQAARTAGLLAPGVLGGGKNGTATAYTMAPVRGDLVGWFSGKEEGLNWTHLPAYNKKVSTLVTELVPYVPELGGIKTASKMMCTCYPGGGARYTMHIDNAGGNGRKLTAVLYLNSGWEPADGGEIRVYLPDRKTVVRDIAPLGGRLLIFFSDVRVPHEVMPSRVDRYAVTLWYFDEKERAAADAAAADEEAQQRERDRVAREIAKFEQQYGTSANAFTSAQDAVPAPKVVDLQAVARAIADGSLEPAVGPVAAASSVTPTEVESSHPPAAAKPTDPPSSFSWRDFASAVEGADSDDAGSVDSDDMTN